MTASFHIPEHYVPKLEVLATLESELGLGLAHSALQSQYDLLCGLSLLVEDWLGLTTITGLLAVVTSLSLSEQGGLVHEIVSALPSIEIVPLLTVWIAVRSEFR
jgi:hypothetical protein